MTEEGRKFVLGRLTDAPDLRSLARVWDSLGSEYARDPMIQTVEDQLKRQFMEEGQRL